MTRIVLLAYLATYGNGPLLARALADRGNEVTMIVARRDPYQFFTEVAEESLILLERGPEDVADARRALERADRILAMALPALTHVLPILGRDADGLPPGAIILSSSHFMADPAASRRLVGASGLAPLAMMDQLPYAPQGSRLYWPPVRFPPLQTSRPTGAPIRFCHAPGKPSRLKWKGTETINRAFADLRGRFGKEVETRMTQGLSHAEALKARGWCDVYIDQILSPMKIESGRPLWGGGLGKNGLEAMAVGCAVVASGSVPEPVMEATPETLDRCLNLLVRHPASLAGLRHEGRRWVEEHCAPDVVARQIEEALG